MYKHFDRIISLFVSRKEQAALKDEMEKMSEMISELRENCKKLQTQLMEVRQLSREQRSVGVQVKTF